MKSLYFIAILPPEPILSEIRHMKVYVKERFDSGRALRSPAHITLVPPFLADEQGLEKVHALLSDVANNASPFDVEIDGFDCFRPRVVFVNPKPNLALESLQRQLIGLSDQWKRYADKGFHAHITIAFRDLSPKAFEKAWAYFEGREFKRLFAADSISLLLNGQEGWSVIREYPLRAS